MYGLSSPKSLISFKYFSSFRWCPRVASAVKIFTAKYRISLHHVSLHQHFNALHWKRSNHAYTYADPRLTTNHVEENCPLPSFLTTRPRKLTRPSYRCFSNGVLVLSYEFGKSIRTDAESSLVAERYQTRLMCIYCSLSAILESSTSPESRSIQSSLIGILYSCLLVSPIFMKFGHRSLAMLIKYTSLKANSHSTMPSSYRVDINYYPSRIHRSTLFQPYLRPLLGFLLSLILPNTDSGPIPTIVKPFLTIGRLTLAPPGCSKWTIGDDADHDGMAMGRREDGSTGVYYQSERYKTK